MQDGCVSKSFQARLQNTGKTPNQTRTHFQSVQMAGDADRLGRNRMHFVQPHFQRLHSGVSLTRETHPGAFQTRSLPDISCDFKIGKTITRPEQERLANS